MRKHSLETSILLALLLILLFAVYGCGTRHAEIIKKDSIYIENTYREGQKIILGNTFTYTPFNNLKPMVIEGKQYSNTIISNDKSKTIIKYKDRNITKTITIEKQKSTDRKDDANLWIGLFLIFAISVFAWFKMDK